MHTNVLQILMQPFKWVLGLAKRGMWVTIVIAATAVVVLFLTVQVANRIAVLRAAPQDNIQWSLAQLDVELLAVDAAAYRASDGSTVNLAKLRQRFDLFYGRVKTTASMPMFRQDLDATGVIDSVSGIRSKLDRLLPVINAPDAQLLVQMGAFRTTIEELRPLTRQVTLVGIKLHAAQSDAIRAEFSVLLRRTAVFNGLLVLALAASMLFLLRQINISKQRTDELQISSNRNASTLVTSLDAIVIINMDGRIVEFNGAASRTFGYSRNAAIGAKLEELIVPERFRTGHGKGLADLRKTGETKSVGASRIEMPALRSDGSEFPVELSRTVTDSAEGQLEIVFLRDISKRIEQENELRKAHDEALEASKIKSQFLAVMSHEMRTPLNGVMAILDLLATSKLDAKQKKYVATATTSAEILKQHVDDVLDLTRIQAGKFELYPRVFDMVELVAEVQNINVAVAAKRNNRITIDMNFPHPHFVADRKRIHQVLTNLVGNAIKFTGDGRIAISAKPVHVKADLVTIEFKIKDTGIGIAKEQQDNIFEDFVTLDSSYQRSAAGTGLGLPICRSIVEAMGGTIGVESTPGSGATFWFRLPLKIAFAKNDKPTELQPHRFKSLNHEHLKVLVVEDNETNRFVAEEMLRASGCEVVMAQDGEEGVLAAGKHRFDLILMDLSMPGMNGWEAARRIRATLSSKSRNSPIYALTAHALPEEHEALWGAGMQGCVLKPLRARQLVELLQLVSESRAAFAQTASFSKSMGNGSESVIDSHIVIELREMLGERLFQEKLDAFITELNQGLHEMEIVANSGHLQKLAARAHKLSGSSAVFGAAQLRSILAALECAAKDNVPQQVAKLLIRTNSAARKFQTKRRQLRTKATKTPFDD